MDKHFVAENIAIGPSMYHVLGSAMSFCSEIWRPSAEIECSAEFVYDETKNSNSFETEKFGIRF